MTNLRYLVVFLATVLALGQSQGFRMDPISLSPTQPLHTDSFTLETESSRSVTVAVTSTAPGVILTVTTPAGQTIDAQNVESWGGRYFEADLSDMPASLMPFPRGHRVQLEFPQQGVGRYGVRIDGGSLAEETGAFLELPFSSMLSVVVPYIPPEISANAAVPMSVERKESGQAITGASAWAEISREGGAAERVDLLDDGAAPDETANDGIYTASYSSTGPGDYTADIWALGQRSNGEQFRQGSPQKFTVHPLYARFTGAHHDRGVDEDGDGRFDRVDLAFEVDVTRPGAYEVLAEIQGAAGGSTRARGRDQMLQPGIQSVVAPLSLEQLHGLGGPGPYSIVEATLTWAPKGEAWSEAHRLTNVGQSRAYALDDVAPFPISLRGLSESAVDTDGDGTFDNLTVELDLDVSAGNVYTYSLHLEGPSGQTVAAANGRQYIQEGAQNLPVALFGPDIRRSGIDGPYAIRSLELSNRHDRTTIAEVGETRPYLAAQFDPLTPRIVEVRPALLQPGEAARVLVRTEETAFLGIIPFGKPGAGVVLPAAAIQRQPPKVSFGRGVTVTGVEVYGEDRLGVDVEVAGDAALGPRNVTVTTESGSFAAPSSFTVAKPARLLSITPREAELDQTLEVAIEAENASFKQGVTQLTFSERPQDPPWGIEVRDVRVLDSDSLRATIYVKPRAPTSYLYLTATTGTETAALEVHHEHSFRVHERPSLGYISPMHARRGESLRLTVSTTRIDLESGPVSVDFGAGVNIEGIEIRGNVITARATVAPDAPLGARPISVETGAGKWRMDHNTLTILPTPRPLSVTPSSAAPGNSVVVTILAEGTLFGSVRETKVSAGEGIYVRDLKIVSATQVTARFTVDPLAAAGPRTIRISSQRDQIEIADAFAVTAPR